MAVTDPPTMHDWTEIPLFERLDCQSGDVTHFSLVGQQLPHFRFWLEDHVEPFLHGEYDCRGGNTIAFEDVRDALMWRLRFAQNVPLTADLYRLYPNAEQNRRRIHGSYSELHNKAVNSFYRWYLSPSAGHFIPNCANLAIPLGPMHIEQIRYCLSCLFDPSIRPIGDEHRLRRSIRASPRRDREAFLNQAQPLYHRGWWLLYANLLSPEGRLPKWPIGSEAELFAKIIAEEFGSYEQAENGDEWSEFVPVGG